MCPNDRNLGLRETGMPKSLSERVGDLESATVKAEGAQLAVHDLFARLLLQLHEPEFEK